MGGIDCIYLVRDRYRWRFFIAVMNLRVARNAENFLVSRGPVSSSARTLLHEVS